MQIRTILYQYIKTLIKHVFLLNFTYELFMSFRILFIFFAKGIRKYLGGGEEWNSLHICTISCYHVFQENERI